MTLDEYREYLHERFPKYVRKQRGNHVSNLHAFCIKHGVHHGNVCAFMGGYRSWPPDALLAATGHRVGIEANHENPLDYQI